MGVVRLEWVAGSQYKKLKRTGLVWQ